jgi:hypothetical protein
MTTQTHFLEEGTERDWCQSSLAHATGGEIATIERNIVENGSKAEGELDEFGEEIADCKPDAAVTWLRQFRPRVRCRTFAGESHGPAIKRHSSNPPQVQPEESDYG